jgi:chemosensory pili system protein ChpC
VSKKSDAENIVVRCVLMPLQGATLILPNAAVSEVVAYDESSEQVPDAEDSWLLGTQIWRQQIIPLVSFERVLGKGFVSEGKRLMVAVCNTLNGDSKRPYIGIMLSDIPHLIRAHHSMIEPLGEQGEQSNPVVGKMKLNGEEVMVPDLDGLEKLVNQELP